MHTKLSCMKAEDPTNKIIMSSAQGHKVPLKVMVSATWGRE